MVRLPLWLAAAGLVIAMGVIWVIGRDAPEPTDRALPPLPMADTPLRILAFGTSLTHGNNWPKTTAAALSNCLGRSVEMVRISHPGADIRWALTQVGQVVLADPDIILVEFAINDADLRDGLWLTQSRAAHRKLIEQLRVDRPDRRIVLMTMNPVSGVLRQLQRPRLAAYYRVQAELAVTEDTGLLDFHARWLALPAAERAMADGLHPDESLAHKVIVPVLVPYLGRLAGGDCPAES